jgi:hypothetical protein
MKRLVIVVTFVLVSVAAEEWLLRVSLSRDVSMSLLAAGGKMPAGALLLAAVTMLVRLFVRLIVPGLVVAEGVFQLRLRLTRGAKSQPAVSVDSRTESSVERRARRT